MFHHSVFVQHFSTLFYRTSHLRQVISSNHISVAILCSDHKEYKNLIDDIVLLIKYKIQYGQQLRIQLKEGIGSKAVSLGLVIFLKEVTYALC